MNKRCFSRSPSNSCSKRWRETIGCRGCSRPFQLTSLECGAIIGQRHIFVLTGEAAHDKAGPALILSLAVAGVTSCLPPFAMRSLPRWFRAGSAYTYAYATLGELLAWITGGTW